MRRSFFSVECLLPSFRMDVNRCYLLLPNDVLLVLHAFPSNVDFILICGLFFNVERSFRNFNLYGDFLPNVVLFVPDIFLFNVGFILVSLVLSFFFSEILI